MHPLQKKADAPNSYWIMCTDGAGQPKVYRRTRTFLKIGSTPTDGEAKAQIEEWRPKPVNNQFQPAAVPDGNRNHMVDNSANRSSNGDLYMPPLQQNLPNVLNFPQKREEDSQDVIPPCTSVILLWKMYQVYQLH